MAPAQSKLAALAVPLVTQHEMRRKRKASYKITDVNFVGAESNAVTKRLKRSADSARAATAVAVKDRVSGQRQSSLVEVEDTISESTISSPKTPSALIEATDRSSDIESDERPDNGESDDDNDDCSEVVTKSAETAEEQRG